LFQLKKHSINKKIDRLINRQKKRSFTVKTVKTVAILNNPKSNLTFNNLKYVQKSLNLSSSNFDIFTFKNKNEHYNELRGIVASKDVFSLFGSIKTPEITKFLDKEYDLLLDFTGMSNIYEKYLSLAIKANFRVGYSNKEELYDMMLQVKQGDVKTYIDETVRYLKIIGLI
jgi:hypothetical protein